MFRVVSFSFLKPLLWKNIGGQNRDLESSKRAVLSQFGRLPFRESPTRKITCFSLAFQLHIFKAHFSY
jgi:hypothetical protein